MENGELTSPPDNELCLKISRGDRGAFGVLYERYHKQLYFLSIKYLKDVGLAEDAVQDVFVKVWRNRASLDEGKSIRGYLFSTLKNTVINRINRDKRRIVQSFSQNEEPNSTDDVFDNLLNKEYEEIFFRGLELLPEKRRVVFELKVNGFSNKQIAEKLRISENTVKVHYYHGSKFIRDFLRKHAGIALSITLALTLFKLS